MKRMLLAVAVTLLPALLPVQLIRLAQADAQPPRYDTDGLCFRQANTPDGVSDQSLSQCLAKQDEALQAIRHDWDDTPTYIQDDCDTRTRATGYPDYVALQNCIETQLRLNSPPAYDPGPPASSGE